MQTLYIAIAVFSITALAGIYLLSLVLRDKETPKPIAALHGLLALSGLALLIAYYVKNTPGPLTSIIVFAIAVLGGLILIYKDLTGKKVPKWLAIGHGLIAIAGYITLLVFTLS